MHGVLQPWPIAAGIAQGTDPRTPQNRTLTSRPLSFAMLSQVDRRDYPSAGAGTDDRVYKAAGEITVASRA